MSKVAVVEFEGYGSSVRCALDLIGAAEVLAQQERIMLKPNVINSSPHPITTHPDCVEALVEYCRECSQAEILIGEGCGERDTMDAFEMLGFCEVARRQDVRLVDLESEPEITLTQPGAKFLPEFHMPRILEDVFLIGVPVLKAHSMAQVTLGLKNMIGVCPARHYGGSHYRKSKLHCSNNSELHEAIVELNKYRKADLVLMDATVGMAEAHIWGPECDPPVNKIVAGFDVVAVDAVGCELLGRNWRKIKHVQLADGELGDAQNVEVLSG